MKKAEREEFLRRKLSEMKRFEDDLRAKGVEYIAGVDEVGRGPLAGPVVAAAVILPADFDVIGIDDSKKLSEKKRNELVPLIRENALAYGIGCIDEKKIDEINILEATKLAMRQALDNAERMLRERGFSHKNRQSRTSNDPGIEHVLFDAISIDEVKIPQTSIIKGDSKSVSIAAASILAKVARDQMMAEAHERWPYYAFDSNKGYGTKAHYEGLDKYGLCPIHRKSFLTKYV